MFNKGSGLRFVINQDKGEEEQKVTRFGGLYRAGSVDPYLLAWVVLGNRRGNHFLMAYVPGPFGSILITSHLLLLLAM